MRNLKKVLSLVLALAMVLSICMVGASAVNYDDFTDEESITKKQAVETLVSLDVIKGYNDGATFNPTGNVTRAEMATMICRILAGGDNMIVDATKPVATYADIDGHWAESYIEYCTSLGIVSGKSPTSFDPDADVTAAEAAKMVMTTLGYNADIEGFKGIGWDINTMAKANTLLLLNNLQGEISSSVPATREQVAQLLFNALSADMVQNYVGTTANVWISSGAERYTQTLLEAKFHAEKLTGVIEANEYADLYAPTGIRKGTTRLALMDNGGDLTGQKQTVEVTTELLDIGKSVIVYWNKDTKRVLYGDTQDTGTNVVREFTTGGKFVGGEGLDRNSVKDAKYFINYSDEYETEYTSDWRIEYNIVLSLTMYEAKELLYTNGAAVMHENKTNGAEITTPTKDEWENNTFENTVKNSYVYEKAIRAEDVITDLDMKYIKNIFAAADKEENIILGEVYVGTKSTEDVSDELSYREFYSKYIGTTSRTLDAFDSIDNGDYLRAVDFNNDGDFDYILKIEFEMHEVDNVANNGDVRFTGTVGNMTNDKGELTDTIEAASLVASDELVKDDVVLTATIDGIVYVDQAPSFEGKVDSYNMRRDILTVEGEEYGQSEIIETTKYQNRIADAEKNVNFTYYQDHFGYIRVFAYPPEAEGNYVLLTDGWYREKIDEDEYAVKAYVDEKIQTFYTTGRTSKEFINDNDETLNNSWGNLFGFNHYEQDGTVRKYPNIDVSTNNQADDDKQAGTNIARYSVDDDNVMTLTDVKTYSYDKKHQETNIKTDYVDLLGTSDLTKGQTSFNGYYLMDTEDVAADWYDGKNVDHSTFDDTTNTWSTVRVQATRNTLFYYVIDNKTVKTAVGYRNTLAVPAEDISAMYAVATNTGKDASGNNYWVADVIVVELSKLSAEVKDVFFNVYATEKNSKDIATSDALLDTGKNDSLLVKTPDGFDNYNNPGRRIKMDFYSKSEPDEDGVVTIYKVDNYAKAGIYAATADRVNGLLTYLTVEDNNAKKKTLEYNSEDVIVYALESKGTDRYGDPKAEAVIRQDGTKVAVEPGDQVIAFCDGNNVIYVIDVTKSEKAIRDVALDQLWIDIDEDYKTGGTDTTDSQKITNAKKLTCKDVEPFGTKTVEDLNDIINELVDISTKYNAGTINLSKTDAANLATLLGTNSDGTIYTLKAEVDGHQTLQKYADKVSDIFGLTAKSRAVTFADGFKAMVQDQHDAICTAVEGKTPAAAVTEIQKIIKYTPAGGTEQAPVPEKWEGTAPKNVAQAGLYTALMNAAEATSAGSSADAGVKSAINTVVTGKGTADDALAAKDMIATDGTLDENKAADIITAIEESTTYTVTVAHSYSAVEGIVITDGDGFSVAADSEITVKDGKITLNFNNKTETGGNIVVTLTKDSEVQRETVTLTAGQATSKEITLKSSGAWTLDIVAETDPLNVTFTVTDDKNPGATTKILNADGVDVTKKAIPVYPGDKVSFTVEPTEGYRVKSVKETDTDVPQDGTTKVYTYTVPANAGADIVIAVTLEVDPAKALEDAKTAAATAISDAKTAIVAVLGSEYKADEATGVSEKKTAYEAAIAANDATAESVTTAKTAYVNALNKGAAEALVTKAGTLKTGEGALADDKIDISGVTGDDAAKQAVVNSAVKTALGVTSDKNVGVTCTINDTTATVTITFVDQEATAKLELTIKTTA